MQAAVKAGEGKVILKTVEVPKPGPGQVLVQVFAAAQNPSDWMKLKRDWTADTVIAGHDFAGVIQQLGPDVSTQSRQVGQRVAGFINACVSPEDGGTFAEYCVADAMMLVDLPASMNLNRLERQRIFVRAQSHNDGSETTEVSCAPGARVNSNTTSTIGLAAFTACQVLWQNQKLPTPLDITKDPFPEITSQILVWGGASAVGQYVIQLAKLSGLKFGADAIFDYRDPHVVSEIKAFCGATELNVAIDSSVIQCIEDRESSYIALVLPVEVKAKYIKSDFTYVYSLLGKPIQGKYPYPAIREHYELGKWSADMLSQLAKKGILRTVPTRIVPNGLADAQYWIDYQEEGKVRAEKIMYRIKSS
ncbi:chaperonin 10-like protein [Lentinula aciculospora]|uniref:Chaperonin 10-like protein n=1 Tax=Lentinula aciculospora TaxID=153920 RepID=A0A9W9AEW1_9AGAR|nr:chaperonin 10-like protein [Lentinula aciculospora]